MTPPQIVASLPPPPGNPAGRSPLRRPHSVRRTSSIDMTWPAGYLKQTHFDGRCRDIYTPRGDSNPVVLAQDSLLAVLSPERTIESIAATPPRDGIGALVGVSGGENLRRNLDATMPAEKAAGSPLYLLLDDLAGSSLISIWAWSRWMDDWAKGLVPDDPVEARVFREKTLSNVCAGFRTGSSALDDIRAKNQNCRPVPPLPHLDDPEGWHDMVEHTKISMRRARRIDIWRDQVLHIESTFQDSASVPEGGRVAVHEYNLYATADPTTLTLIDVVAEPRILPYPECPAAVPNTSRMVGVAMSNLRIEVLKQLRRTDGCTHLNDALRALAEVPVLLKHLDNN